MDLKFIASETATATALGLLIGVSAGAAVLVWAFERGREYYARAL